MPVCGHFCKRETEKKRVRIAAVAAVVVAMASIKTEYYLELILDNPKLLRKREKKMPSKLSKSFIQ